MAELVKYAIFVILFGIGENLKVYVISKYHSMYNGGICFTVMTFSTKQTGLSEQCRPKSDATCRPTGSKMD